MYYTKNQCFNFYYIMCCFNISLFLQENIYL